VQQRYWHPSPRLKMGIALRIHATSCMDISDGLMVDARKLCTASTVGARLYHSRLPLSDAGQYAQHHHPDLWQECYSAGDDYELLFTMPRAHETALRSLCPDTPFTYIGDVVATLSTELVNDQGVSLTLPLEGFEH
jgi:thiamine-monophosphate kinase